MSPNLLTALPDRQWLSDADVERSDVASTFHATLVARETTGPPWVSVRGPVVNVTYFDPEPEWLRPTVAKMNQLLQLPPNWDSYGGQPVSLQSLGAALRLLFGLSKSTLPPPEVVPMSAGGVQLEWHQSGVDLEISVGSAGEISCYYRDGCGNEAEGDLRSNLLEVRNGIEVLSSGA